MAIGWMIKVDVTGDGYKDSVRGYAVAIRNRDEAMAAAREASGERVAEVDGEMTRETFDELHLKPGGLNAFLKATRGLLGHIKRCAHLNAALTSPRPDDATLAARHRSIVPNTWSQSVVLTP